MTPEELETRKQDMWKLRFIDGLTLQAIGTKYGISRERVRQIIPDTGRFFRRKWTEEYIRLHGNVETYHDLKNVRGVRNVYTRNWGQTRHRAISGRNQLFAQYFEEKTNKILTDNGIENKLMPYLCGYDIETSSGIRIDVKASRMDVSKMATQRHNYPCWQLPEMKSGRDCDFFFCFLPDESEEDGFTYFVIPSFEFYDLQIGSRIRVPWPRMSQKPSKWHKYHKAIDLIKEKTNG